VAKDSKVETFAAIRFQIDNARWKNVPFYVRAGKCMPVTITEVLVRLKRPTNQILDEIKSCDNSYFRFRLSPHEEIALGLKIKKAGEDMVGDIGELVVHETPKDEMPPYERLLGDAMHGDATSFSREDSVENAWRIVDPILNKAVPVYQYEKNSWGPAEVEEKLEPPQGWHNPLPDDNS
jgi:glucose-6-phosphate 1-dehydrogenase